MTATGKLIGLIESIARLGYTLGLGLAVLYVILTGLKYSRGGGKDAKEIHGEIKLLIIGVILIILSYTIPTIIRSFVEK